MNLAFRLARRELRGGVRGLRIVLACLALGVAIIGAVGTLRESVDAGLASDGRRILGGDLEIQGGAQPLPDELRTWLRARGAAISDVIQMRSMLIAPSGERQLVELKAVDTAWPLVGAAELDPPGPVQAVLANQGLVAERVVLDRLGLKPGDPVRLGDATFTLRGRLETEPDRIASPQILGPRVMIATAALPSTALIQPGSMVQYALRVALPPGGDVPTLIRDLRAAFPHDGWRLRDARNAAPGVDRFIDQTALFMTLVGLTSLLVGGIGVANGVRAWLQARARTLAILRCLGSSSALIFAVCLIQVMALALIGVIIGVAAGAALPILAASLLGDLLPVPPVAGIYPAPLAIAALYGLLTAGAFALWPLGRAARIPGAALFRDQLIPENIRPSAAIVAASAVLATLLIALTVLTSPDAKFALGFCAGAIATLALFRAGASALMALARAAPRLSAPWARLGIANLHRPGTATPLMLVSIGLGLSTLAAVALIQGNLRRQIMEELPTDAPSFFFIDIQNDQLPVFQSIAAAQPGVTDIEHVPNLRARLVAVNGIPADQVQATPDTQWALRGDRGLTYAATPPEGTKIVAGKWWPPDYTGPPLVSFDSVLARGWGVGIGDTITVNVLGRNIDLKIASLREIAWRTLSLNFAMVASPGLLASAPHANIATLRAAPAAQGPLLRAVTDKLPNVSGIRVEDVLKSVADLLGRIGIALAATGSLTLIAGALVLAGAVASGQRRRVQEAVILKTLGASRDQIRAAWLVEFGIVGLAAGLIAALIGTAASFGVVHFVMGTDWAFLPGTLAVTLLGSLAMMLLLGYAGTAGAMRAKAATYLRNE